MDDTRSQKSRSEQAACELGGPLPSPRFVTYYLEQQEDGSWRFTGESTPT